MEGQVVSIVLTQVLKMTRIKMVSSELQHVEDIMKVKYIWW